MMDLIRSPASPWLAGPSGSVRTEEGGLARVEVAWQRSDALFELLRPEALPARPIALRQPFIFYLGHLPAFAWNHLGRRLRGLPPVNDAFDELFARGIDPLDESGVPPAPNWPPVEDVYGYRDEVRAAIREAFGAGRERRARERWLLAMVLEHELMHHETLLYMLQALPLAHKIRPEGVEYAFERHVDPGEQVKIPGARVRLGAAPGSLPFGWDNEFPIWVTDAPAVTMDVAPVRNADFLEFVEANGYARPDLWTAEAWRWRTRRGLEHPLSWARENGRWAQRTLFENLPLERAAEWPVAVSLAEASAYARFRGRRLPTEVEFERAAYGTAERPRAHPWGDDAPLPEHGNFDFRHWSPTPVGSHPAGASPEGVRELVGNGWEWTSTVFGPYPGFKPMPEYPGYSSAFFDGTHHVLRGASWATDRALLRRSFRNWFQPHYPYVFAKFRLVDPA
jgi:ergothioneine biosynthesis protein EgtB